MSDPLATTFGVLAATGNQHAVDVLLAALDAPSEWCRAQAVSALLRRGAARGQIEVVRRLESLGPAARAVVDDQAFYLESVLRECLLHGDLELRRNALEIVRTAESYQQFPALLALLREGTAELAETAALVIAELADRLYEHCQPGESKPPRRYLRNAPQVRFRVLEALNAACNDFATLIHRATVVEAALALGGPDSLTVKKVLSQAVTECRELAAGLLVSSRHPGVMQLVLDLLSKNYPHPRAAEAIRQRQDPEFLAHLLRWFPKRLTPIQQKNFREIEWIAWLEGDLDDLVTLPPALQPPLVEFVMATGLPGERKLRVLEWLVRYGSHAGRQAAAEVLATLDGEAIHGIICEGLESDDPDVQAWATGQLRNRRIPEALGLLIERLDSPLEAVRATARRELDGFNLERMLGLFDQLPRDVCRRAAQLVRKIDLDYVEKLTSELTSPVRPRRIRAARCARALGLHREIVPGLLTMLDDTDPLVRRTALEILADVPTEESVLAITRLLDDPSPRVRDEARRAVERVRQELLDHAAR